MLLEIGKAVSFITSILSLCALLDSAFFVPGSRWEERLVGSLLRIALAGCVCFASGLRFPVGGAIRRACRCSGDADSSGQALSSGH